MANKPDPKSELTNKDSLLLESISQLTFTLINSNNVDYEINSLTIKNQ